MIGCHRCIVNQLPDKTKKKPTPRLTTVSGKTKTVEMDHNSYSLWQKQDQLTHELNQIKNVLYKVNGDRSFKNELDQIDIKQREDATTLSEKRRAELTELLNGYKEPLMDRAAHEAHVQAHRKYLEKLAKYKRRDAIIAGISPKGINAEDMAIYSFAHAAGKAVINGSSNSNGNITPTLGLDPETGVYSIVLRYEGSLSATTFRTYQCRYASTQKINLYETIKSFFGAGQRFGLAKAQLAELLLNLLETREVRESPDAMTHGIFKNDVKRDPRKAILNIINMVSRNNQQTYIIMDSLKNYRRPPGLPIEYCINSLRAICGEYYRHYYPRATDKMREEKTEAKIMAMLLDIVDKDVKRELKKAMRENDNNGVENTVKTMENFLAKAEGDKKVIGGQSITSQALSYMSFYNNTGDQEGREHKPSRDNRGRDDRRRRRREGRVPRTPSGNRAGSRSSASGMSASSTPATSRESSRSPSQGRRGMSSGTSRSSSVNSNVSTPRPRRKDKTAERASRKKEKEKEKKKKKEAHYTDRRDQKRTRSSEKKDQRRAKTPENKDRCPICYESQCTNRGVEKCQLRPELLYNKEPTGPCGICRRGFHITTENCLAWPLKREQLKQKN